MKYTYDKLNQHTCAANCLLQIGWNILVFPSYTTGPLPQFVNVNFQQGNASISWITSWDDYYYVEEFSSTNSLLKNRTINKAGHSLYYLSNFTRIVRISICLNNSVEFNIGELCITKLSIVEHGYMSYMSYCS